MTCANALSLATGLNALSADDLGLILRHVQACRHCAQSLVMAEIGIRALTDEDERQRRRGRIERMRVRLGIVREALDGGDGVQEEKMLF